MRPTCGVHVVWRHFVPELSTSFSYVSWSVLWLHHQFVTDVTAWLMNPNPSCSKNRKLKEKEKKSKIKMKSKNQIKSTVNNLDSLVIKSSNLKRRNFLLLLNNNLSEIESVYIKVGPWLQHFSFSNLLCAWDIWAITNYTLIRVYCLKFFPKEEFKYLYRFYSIKSRWHILYKCRQFNKY